MKDKRSITSALNGAKGGRPKGRSVIEDFEAMEGEVFRPVPNYDGYFASSLGRIISVKRGRAKIKSQQTRKSGYMQLTFHSNGVRKNMLVHRAVLYAFKGLPENDDMQASHQDGSKSNNNIENLKWETMLENNGRKREHGTEFEGEARSGTKLTDKKVLDIRAMYFRGGVMQKDLARTYSVSKSLISAVIRGRIWSHVT